ncbi:hypothetical protein Val02_21380 [Virgisporangium aliadipatigenens]|uniref:Uncharacterized protein n=1 Tax=Virgisporangium aliadipatigenens TaxID=741659 RepID=A0A8J4DQC3_9ACTN|nr:hypothetical protein [Virgisporangium aliadipatigenens]GIJ45252.1 hypothetical protein Val02_21380 [Virgisporangium aliadipatigenens]
MPVDRFFARRGHARLPVYAFSAVVVVVAAGAAMYPHRDPGGRANGGPASTVPTAVVTRGDLSTGRSMSGTWGVGVPRTVVNGRAGVVTWLPPAGATIDRGQVLYRLDGAAVPLFFGSPTLTRTLSDPGTVGRDVALVVDNLRALGYPVGPQPGPGAVVDGADALTQVSTDGETRRVRVAVREGDGVLTAAVIDALRQWQRDNGLDADGRLEVGDIAVAPGAVRVDVPLARAGDAASGALMTVVSAARVVTVRAPAIDVDAVRDGGGAIVRLPGGTELPGRVAAVEPLGQHGDGRRTATVTVVADRPDAAQLPDGVEVTVDIAGRSRLGVLTVPVNAVIDLPDGSHAVQPPDAAPVAVTVGLVSRGVVEISGAGVREGMRVVAAP